MAWYPHAIRKNIPPGSNDPRIIPVGSILHVAVSGADSLFGYFDGPSGGIESTWYIRYDGTVEQYRDSDYEADANGRGNSWIGSDGRRYGLHSVETAGFEHGEWTDAQIRSIKDLLAWDAREHGWPLQVIPRWNGSGVGYHVMFGAPGPYTNVRGKTCPGPDRVRQFHDIITPWLAGGQEDDMTPDQAQMLKDLHEVVANGNGTQLLRPDKSGERVSMRFAQQEVWELLEPMYDVLCNHNAAQMRRPGGGTASVRYGVERSWAGVEALKAMVAELATGPAADPDVFLDRVQARVEQGIADGVESEIPAVVTAVLDALGDRAGLDQDDVVEAVKTALREGADA